MEICRELHDIIAIWQLHCSFLVQFLVFFVVSSPSQALIPGSICLNVLHFHHKKLLNSTIFMNKKVKNIKEGDFRERGRQGQKEGDLTGLHVHSKNLYICDNDILVSFVKFT